MDEILNLLEPYIPEGLNINEFLRIALILCIGMAAFALLGRFVFGRHSVLNASVSSAVSILFIYAATIAIYSTGVNLTFLLSPLPFVNLNGDYLSLFQFAGNHYTVICEQLVSMIILAFLANLADGWLPQGKKVVSWFLFRCLSVLIAMLLHLIAAELLEAFLPAGFLTYAPTILLALLVIMMAVGALKLLVGILLSTVNPIIGILYTFFFAHVLGKQISKAVFTTVIISGILYLLNYLGVSSVYIGAAALIGYIPFLILLLIVWYFITRHL